jgi:hypothetical protein
VLAKSSAADYATGWVTPSSGGGASAPPLGLFTRVGGAATSAYYAPGWTASEGWGTYQVPYQHVDWVPYYLEGQQTLHSLGFATTVAAAGQVVSVCLYAADEAWQPTTLVYASPEINVASAAQYDVGAPLGIVLPPGRYLGGMQVKNAVSGNAVTCRAPIPGSASFVRESVSDSSASIGGAVWRLLRVNLVWTLFTNPAPAAIKWTTGPLLNGVPFLFMKFSA